MTGFWWFVLGVLSALAAALVAFAAWLVKTNPLDRKSVV